MDTIATMSGDDRGAFFTQAAIRKELDPVMIEKDYWVCWALKRLFTELDLRDVLIFKGGTSLSKGFGLIERFSEDIDLTIDKRSLGLSSEADPANAGSSSAAKKRVEKLKQQAEAYISGDLCNSIRTVFSEKLSGEWSIVVDDEDPQTLWFYYPHVLAGNSGYIKEAVRLEFGVLGDPWPTEARPITPYLCETFPDQFQQPVFNANILTAERSFWEKVTLLHTEHHRSEDANMPIRISRHYYDVMMLKQRGVASRALRDASLLDDVIKNKKTYFSSKWASYETARLGSLRLLPRTHWIEAIKADYTSMEPMFFQPSPPSFDSVMNEIALLEKELNAQPESNSKRLQSSPDLK